MRRLARAALAAGAGAGVTGLAALARSRRAAPDVPFSPLTAGWRVGPEYAERRGVAGDPLPGEMDSMDAYARPGFDPDAVHPTVRRFYEETTDFELAYRVRWHRGFRTGAAGAARLTARLGQLALPGRGGAWRRLVSEVRNVPAAADPREGARLWVRTDGETGDAVFVAAYASHVSDGERFTNIAVPLPGSNLSTVLRIRHLDDPERVGIEHTTRAPDPGLYLVVPPAAYALPADQRFRVWPGDTADRRAPTAPARWGDPSLLASHEMWVCGRQFLTVSYAGYAGHN